MASWTKRVASTMLDSATTRKSLLALAAQARGCVARSEWDDLWQYALMRFDRLPDDGTTLREPGGRVVAKEWPSLRAASKADVANWRRYASEPDKARKLGLQAHANLIRLAKPYVIGVSSPEGDAPPEFRDWLTEGKMVDMHLEQLVFADEFELNPDAVNHLVTDFMAGIALAMKKGGQWFLMTAGTLLQGKKVVVTVTPVSEGDIEGYYRLPEDWEQKVAIVDQDL